MQWEMPKPGPAHEVLAKLSGDWEGDETMLPSPWSPEQQQRKGKIRARVLEGFFVTSDYEQSMPDGTVTFRGHGVYSYDPATEEYKMYWFDSMGGPGGVASGKYENDRLTFENTSPMGHHRYRYTFEDGRRTVFEMAISQDGETWQQSMVGDYRPAG